ncbi:hypothetical protein ACH4VR_29455 [Streptomyces sp. NPDC020883]|uniref:hypothetical protein n=1 Tax=Streptomyces sp. NPDC020883 TaxID=3365099 RepID=UPI00378B2542
MARFTVREAVRAHESNVCRVESVGSTVITVQESIHLPNGGWGSCDPDKIAETRVKGTRARRVTVGADRWVIARLGHVDEIVEGFRRHRDYVEWRAAYGAAVTEQEASAARYRARIEARDRRRGPLLAAIEGFNVIVGEKLLHLQSFALGPDEIGQIEYPVEWFAQGNRLGTYLAGLLHEDQITPGQYADALGHLRTLGLHRAEPPTDLPTATEQ